MTSVCKEISAKSFLVFALGIILMSFSTRGAAQEKIRLSYSALSPSTAFLWIPKEKGFFRKHGLEVEILLIESGSLTLASPQRHVVLERCL